MMQKRIVVYSLLLAVLMADFCTTSSGAALATEATTPQIGQTASQNEAEYIQANGQSFVPYRGLDTPEMTVYRVPNNPNMVMEERSKRYGLAFTQVWLKERTVDEAQRVLQQQPTKCHQIDFLSLINTVRITCQSLAQAIAIKDAMAQAFPLSAVQIPLMFSRPQPQ